MRSCGWGWVTIWWSLAVVPLVPLGARGEEAQGSVARAMRVVAWFEAARGKGSPAPLAHWAVASKVTFVSEDRAAVNASGVAVVAVVKTATTSRELVALELLGGGGAPAFYGAWGDASGRVRYAIADCGLPIGTDAGTSEAYDEYARRRPVDLARHLLVVLASVHDGGWTLDDLRPEQFRLDDSGHVCLAGTPSLAEAGATKGCFTVTSTRVLSDQWYLGLRKRIHPTRP